MSAVGWIICNKSHIKNIFKILRSQDIHKLNFFWAFFHLWHDCNYKNLNFMIKNNVIANNVLTLLYSGLLQKDLWKENLAENFSKQ